VPELFRHAPPRRNITQRTKPFSLCQRRTSRKAWLTITWPKGRGRFGGGRQGGASHGPNRPRFHQLRDRPPQTNRPGKSSKTSSSHPALGKRRQFGTRMLLRHSRGDRAAIASPYGGQSQRSGFDRILLSIVAATHTWRRTSPVRVLVLGRVGGNNAGQFEGPVRNSRPWLCVDRPTSNSADPRCVQSRHEELGPRRDMFEIATTRYAPRPRSTAAKHSAILTRLYSRNCPPARHSENSSTSIYYQREKFGGRGRGL